MVRFTMWSFVLRLNICWGLRNGDTGEVTEGAEITGSRSSVVHTYIGKIPITQHRTFIYCLFVLYNEAFVITLINVNDSFVKFTYLYMIVMK